MRLGKPYQGNECRMLGEEGIRMKKRIVRLLIGCFVFVLLCIAAGGFYKNTDSGKQVYARPVEEVLANRDLPAPTDHEEEFYRTQADSVEIYNCLLEEFMDSESTSYAAMRAGGSGIPETEAEYPDYYGGVYIDQNTGGLVVLVKEEALDMKSAATRIASLTNETTTVSSRSVDNAVRLEACEVSYNEMLEVQDYLTEQMDALCAQGVEITSLAVDIMNGGVMVSIKDLTEEKEAIVNNLADCSFLRFEDRDYAEEQEAIGGGYEIFSAGTYTSSTVGFPAKRTGRYGFVIAGHAGDVVGKRFVYSNGDAFGTVGRTAFYNNSTADAAFLIAEPGMTVTNVLKNGGVIWAAQTNTLPVGANVSMYGAVSKLQRGKILYTDVIAENEQGMKFLKQWAADYAAQSGDSGAPVLFYEGNYGGQTKYSLYGIHKGSDEEGELACFSPYKNIVDELGLYCVTATKTVPYK